MRGFSQTAEQKYPMEGSETQAILVPLEATAEPCRSFCYCLSSLDVPVMAVTLHRTETELRACHTLQDRTDNEQIAQGQSP